MGLQRVDVCTHSVLRPETTDLSDALLLRLWPLRQSLLGLILDGGWKSLSVLGVLFFFRQGFVGAPVAAGRSQEQTSPLAYLLPKLGQACSLYGVR